MDKSHEYQFDADKLAKLEADNAALRNQLAAAQKDAERYRWLRKSHHDDPASIGVTQEKLNGWGRTVAKSLRNSALDAAIDAAIAQEKKG